MLSGTSLGGARAALTLALVLAGCGSTTANQGAGAGGGGAMGGGGSASGGTAPGGASGSGGAASGGSGGREQSGGAAGRGQGASGASGSLCPGATLDPTRAATPQCSSVADCQALTPAISSPRCQTTPPTYSCGGVAPLHQCNADLDCAAGLVCNMGGCGYAVCAVGCPTTACASYEDCNSGHCAPKACDASGALPCDTGSECKSLNGGAASCEPIACNAGFACAAGWDCAPGPTADLHGCVHRVCSRSADCACGYCVSGLCEPTPGYCFPYAPPG